MITYIKTLAAVLKNCTPEEARNPAFECQTVFPEAGPDQLKNILKLVFAILGFVALIWMIIGAMGFITGMGNPEKIAKARKTIIFTAVGLIVAVSAEAIIFFVIGNV